MPSISPTANLWVPGSPAAMRSSTCNTIATPIGSMVTAVAVFEIHIDRNAAAIMKPSTMRAGPPPTRRMMLSAMRRCRFQRCAWARRLDTFPPSARPAWNARTRRWTKAGR